MAIDDRRNLRGKRLDAAHHHHVVAAADDAEARRRAAAARPAGAGQDDDVAGAEAHQRLALAADMGQHQLAALAVAPRQHRAGLRLDQLRVQHVERHEMQVGVELGLAGEVAEHVRHAVVGVARRQAPGGFQPAAEIGVVEPGLAAEQAQPQAEVARLEIGKMLGDDALEHRRVGGRAGDRGDPELADGADQQLRVADPEGDDGSARRLQRGVVGEPADPQPVIEAVNDAMAGAEPARRLGARADHGGLPGIAGGEREVHRRTRRSRGAVDADHLAGRRRQVVAEGRLFALALPQHLLVGQRQVGQVLQPARRRHALPGPAMQRRAGGDVVALLLPERLAMRRQPVEIGELGAVDQHRWPARQKMSGSAVAPGRPARKSKSQPLSAWVTVRR